MHNITVKRKTHTRLTPPTNGDSPILALHHNGQGLSSYASYVKLQSLTHWAWNSSVKILVLSKEFERFCLNFLTFPKP